MENDTLHANPAPLGRTSQDATTLFSKMVNIVPCPGEVFGELAGAPARVRHWLVPTLLVALASVLLSGAANPGDQTAALGALADPGRLEVVRTRLRVFSALTTILAVFAATGWSAFVLWLAGRLFLGARFSFLKALEVVGLTGSIVLLGNLTTALLGAATGDAAARFALSLLAPQLAADHAVKLLLSAFDVFSLWTTVVLAVGLAKLSGVAFKEAALWVFGYWLLLRVALIALAG